MAHVYHYSQSENRWLLITTLELSAQYCSLSGKAVCLNDRIYWQTCIDKNSQKYHILSTEYHVKLGKNLYLH